MNITDFYRLVNLVLFFLAVLPFFDTDFEFAWLGMLHLRENNLIAMNSVCWRKYWGGLIHLLITLGFWYCWQTFFGLQGNLESIKPMAQFNKITSLNSQDRSWNDQSLTCTAMDNKNMRNLNHGSLIIFIFPMNNRILS